MTDVTSILSAIEQGDPNAADQLLPLVYDELRTLAAQKLAQEKPGQTLQATALVHEAYLRLVDTEKAQHWNSRGHFFAAATEAMRRILVDQARCKRSRKRVGQPIHAAGPSSADRRTSNCSVSVRTRHQSAARSRVHDPAQRHRARASFRSSALGNR